MKSWFAYYFFNKEILYKCQCIKLLLLYKSILKILFVSKYLQNMKILLSKDIRRKVHHMKERGDIDFEKRLNIFFFKRRRSVCFDYHTSSFIRKTSVAGKTTDHWPSYYFQRTWLKNPTASGITLGSFWFIKYHNKKV